MNINIALLAMLAASTSVYAEAPKEIKGELIPLTNPSTDEPPLGTHRSLQIVPLVSIDGDTIYFYDDFEEDVTISIVESDPVTNEESLVYSTALSSEQSEIELPQFLSGSYIIYVEVGSTLYYGYIEVE